MEDRRGRRTRRGAFKGGIGTIVVALALGYFFGIDPTVILQIAQGPGAVVSSNSDYKPTPEEAELVDFVSVVLADTEDTWREVFRNAGMKY